MKRIGRLLLSVIVVGLVAAQAPAPRSTAPKLWRGRLRLGVGDAAGVRWDGTLRITGGTLRALDLEQPGPGERAGGDMWQLATGLAPRGVLVTAQVAEPRARLQVRTAQGNFDFSLDQAEFGEELTFLGGRARVERVPLAVPLGTVTENQDYPAAVEAGDTVAVAYVAFTPAGRAQRWPRQIPVKPLSYDALAQPTGGDQVMLVEYSRTKRSWGAPQPVSAVRQDVCGVAVAIDAGGRLWVVWSAQGPRGFDIFARLRQDGRWGEEIRLTDDPGPDINPVAVTDSNGVVWVAWQGYRRDNFEILVTRQRGPAFAKEERVSVSAANDWDAQIAAGPDGEVAIAWDTYDRGNYDVYVRRMRAATAPGRNGSTGMETPVAVAATPKFEARPALTYDRDHRIWVAYEESWERWGKEFGAYNTSGAGLFQGRTVRVKVLDGARVMETADRLDSDGEVTELPDPELAAQRTPSHTPYPPAEPGSAYPRLATDGRGVVFLASRVPAPGPPGTAWMERLVYFDGQGWSGAVPIPESDHRLEQRPVLLSTGPGEMLLFGATDGRARQAAGGPADGVPSHLVVSEISTGVLGRTPLLMAVKAESTASAAAAGAEQPQTALVRGYRLALGKENLQVLRGELRRYTDLSAGGEREGSLTDAFRYALDAAALDWIACCDQDAGGEYPWWTTEKMADVFHLPGRLVTLFAYDRGGAYPEGSRVVLLGRRGVRPLPRLLPPGGQDRAARDTAMLHEYLRRFEGLAVVHSPATEQGTDWSTLDASLEPVVEIYQGYGQSGEQPGAPRAARAEDAIGGWRPDGLVSRALDKGARIGFAASSGHLSTHTAYTFLWTADPTRRGLLDALRRRRVYAATANILADVTCDGHLMGEELRVKGAPMIRVKLTGTADFRRVRIIRDGREVYVGDPHSRVVDFGWPDPQPPPKGATASYYVRAEQEDGEMVWVSPMWITIE
jgi:hypothetical protein